MIHFIELENREKLEILRASLSDNSNSLIQLFRERARLAREIGRLKSDMGLPSRIRGREEEVLNKLEDMDPFSKAIISALFEYSIVNEDRSSSGTEAFENEADEIKISGPRKHLEFLAGMLVSRPGVEVYTTGNLPDSIINGLQLNGAHIIEGNASDPDITICLEKGGKECDIFISDDNEMSMRIFLPTPSSSSVIKVSGQ